MTQAIPHPHGVTVFGSHVLRIAPDVAVITVAVNRLDEDPSVAFATTREATGAVRAFLREQGVADADVRASHVSLRTERRYRGSPGQYDLIGHRATVQISVSLSDIARLESVLVGVVSAGAHEVNGVRFETSELQEHRARARAAAVRAAHAKATLYAEAAGVRLGKVLHVEDVDPTTLRGAEHGHGHVPVDAGEGAYEPGSITVNGAVKVAYAIL